MPLESAELKLKAALSLLAETSEHTADINKFREARRAASEVEDDSLKSFLQSIKKLWNLRSEISLLSDKLERAERLADEAGQMEPGLTLVANNGGMEIAFSPVGVKAEARLQKGLLSLACDKMKEAERHFEASIDLQPNSRAQLFLAYAIMFQGRRRDAINAFQRVIELAPESHEAVEATKELSWLSSIKPKNKKLALLLAIFAMGIDRIYLGDVIGGFKKVFTVGGLFVWWALDIVRISTNRMRDSRGFLLE